MRTSAAGGGSDRISSESMAKDYRSGRGLPSLLRSMGNDFYHQALTPAILFARESLNFSLQRFGVLRQDTGLPGECLIRNTHSYFGMRANVSHPIGSRILSYDVVT